MLLSSTDLGKHPNVCFNGPRAPASAVLAVVTKTKIAVTTLWLRKKPA
jgi:hypothetical protein